MSDDDLVRRLSEPFPPEVLRALEKGGTRLTYVPGPEVVVRLNSVLGVGQWSFQVVEHHVVEDHVVVLGRLTVGGAVYEQFGGQPLKRYSGGTNQGKPLDFADDLKGAATDAMKKCAQALGVGLELARKEDALAWQARQDEIVTCPVAGCGEQRTRTGMRDHVVDAHDWIRKPDGTVKKPGEAPQVPQETPETPESGDQAPDTPAEPESEPEAPESSPDEIPEDLDAWLAEFISERLRGQHATKAYLSYRREQRLPSALADMNREQKVGLWQFAIGIEPLLETA